jgi:hypothetical protein
LNNNSKDDKKHYFALISLIVGIVALFTLLFLYIDGMEYYYGPGSMIDPNSKLMGVLFYICGILMLLGLISGITGLFSKMKILAISGIIINLLPVVFLLILYNNL